MPFDVTESVLPGVGKKYELHIDDEQSVAVIIHSGGQRELHYREHPEVDYKPVVDLTDSQARTLGLFLVGAYYQPIASDIQEETTTGEHIEWYLLTKDSPLIDTTLQRAKLQQFGVTLLGIERDGTVDSSPPADFEFQAGDRLIIIGTEDDHETLETRLTRD